MKLRFREWSDQVQYVIKTIQDNFVIDCIGLVYAETKTELSKPIEQGVVCYEN